MRYPSVYIGVPIGFTKEYSTLYMLASLRNIDYPPEKIQLTFSITCIKNHKESLEYRSKLSTLISASNMPYTTKIIETWPTDEDYIRWGPYFGVITNLHAMRLDFLQSNHEYFLLLGGDNPPHRDTLKKLVMQNVDVASAFIRQRPARVADNSAYPVIWQTHWNMNHLSRNLEPDLREQLRLAWIEFGFLKHPEDETLDQQIIDDALFGSGCSLIKREVFEYAGYALGKAGVHSEDLHFCLWARLLGFQTRVDMTARCGHFDEDGQIY